MKHTDLELEIDTIGLPGRKPVMLAPYIERQLEESDLALLASERGIKPPALRRVSERHHALARILAAGTSPGEAATILGLSASRVSILQADPTFQELVEMYRDKVVVAFEETIDHIAGLSKEAVIELRNRLEEDPSSFSHKMLLAVFEKTADRSGHGPTSVQVNVNADLASRLDLARKRALEARLEQARDITPSEGAE